MQTAETTGRESDIAGTIDLDKPMGQLLPTAETTGRDSDTTGTTDLDEQMGQLLPAATSRDRDDVVALGQPQQQLLQTATAVNKDAEVIDADMHTCKLPPKPYWIQHLELREHDKELLTGGN